MIVFDTTTLSVVWVPGATVSSRRTKKPIRHAKERVDQLIELIAANDDVIIIPAPVLSEIVVKIPTKADELLKRIKSSPWFKVEGFDAAAAVELGLRTAQAIEAGDKREGLQADWTKIKFDRQIASIALVVNAAEIISDDGDVAAICERWNIPVRSIEDLPLPAEFIPPPLLEGLVQEEDEPIEEPKASHPASAAQLRRSSSEHPERQARAGNVTERASSKEVGKE